MVFPAQPEPAAEREVWFEVHGKRYEFPTDLTFGEARKFKELAGMSLEESGGSFGTDAIRAMVFIALKRADPRVTEANIDELVISETLKSSDEAEPEVAEAPLAQTTPATPTATSATGFETPQEPSPVTTLSVSGARG